MRTIADLQTAFLSLNAMHFGGVLVAPRLEIDRLSGAPNGWYMTGGRIALAATTLARGARFALDTLLHELVHHALAHDAIDGRDDHGVAFCRVANPIGRRLGVRAVRPSTSHAEQWPLTLRAAGYYETNGGAS